MKKDFVRKEIGSEFWDVPVGTATEALLNGDARWFISGTAALEYIIRDISQTTELKRVGVPSWCCSCMIHPFADAGIEVQFYPVYVDADGMLTCDYSDLSKCDATLVLSYFGYNRLNCIGKPGGALIRDLTHSLFCGGALDDALYYFGSLRKWAGFWTGGYAWKKGAWNTDMAVQPADAEYVQLRRNAMDRKQDYLTGVSDSKDYLELFEEAEDFLDHCGIMGSCQQDIQLAGQLDSAFIRSRRRENALVLLESLKDLALFPEVLENDCPMFVPVLLPDQKIRDQLRRYLISREIYCPVHWPVSQFHVLSEKDRVLYDRSLSIVCDQRYDREDMKRIVEAIKSFFE